MKRYHILSSDDDTFLAEIELKNGLAEMYNLYTSYGTSLFSEPEGETLYAELLSWACFELGIDNEDACITDEDETEVLY